MMRRMIVAAVAAAALVGTPALARANVAPPAPAAASTTSVAPFAAALQDSDDNSIYFIGGAIAIAAAVGLYFLLRGSDDEPVSP